MWSAALNEGVFVKTQDYFCVQIWSRCFSRCDRLFHWTGTSQINISRRSCHYFWCNVWHRAKIIENTLKMGPFKIQEFSLVYRIWFRSVSECHYFLLWSDLTPTKISLRLIHCFLELSQTNVEKQLEVIRYPIYRKMRKIGWTYVIEN